MNEALSIKEAFLQKYDNDLKKVQKDILLTAEDWKKCQPFVDAILIDEFPTTKAKGDALEQLFYTILTQYGFFESVMNQKTSSNEIDLNVHLNGKGKRLKSEGYIDLEDHFVVECKNIASKIDVTIVGKLWSILLQHNLDLGIIVSRYGLTGSGWSDAIGLTKKILLKDSKMIICLTLDDLMTLKEHSLFDLIDDKKREIRFDCDLNRIVENG